MSNKEAVLRPSTTKTILLEGIFLLLLIVGGYVFRYAQCFKAIWENVIDYSFFSFAQVTETGLIYSNPHVISKIYVFLLNFVCLFLGNVYEACMLIQFILFLLAMFVWYFLIRKVYNPIAALFFAAGAMLLPDVIRTSISCNPIVLLYVWFGITAWTLVLYTKSKKTGILLYLQTCLTVICSVVAASLDISGALFVVAVVFTYIYRFKNTRKSDNIVSAIVSAVVFSYVLFTNIYIHSVLGAISPNNPLYFNSYYGLKIVLPTIETLKVFMLDLVKNPLFLVFIVTFCVYWFVANKRIVTWLIVAIFYLLLLEVLKLDTYLSHDFLIYMLLITLVGIIVCKLLLRIYEQGSAHVTCDKTGEEPEITIVKFEDEEAVEVPEKPLIFIPKSFETPKRISKPKIDFEIDVAPDKNCYDVEVPEQADFDIL